MADLPQPLPGSDATPDDLAAWVSRALPDDVVATWRPGHSEHAPLLVRFAGGRELFFETVADACRPERFGSAVIAVTGKPMAAYSRPQLAVVVAALVRMATLSRELDERDFWEDTGSTFLRGCLSLGQTKTITLEVDTEAGRGARYSDAVRYAAELGHRGDDQLPHVLVAVDVDQLLVPRGAFLTFANRRRRGVSPGTVNAQMRRIGWDLYDLRPRKPEAPEDYPRPHVRMWRIPNWWDGLGVEIKAGNVVAIAVERGPVVPPGPTECARDRARAPGSGTTRDHGTSTEDQGTAS